MSLELGIVGDHAPPQALAAAAEAAGVSLRTARKWLRRFEQEGLEGLRDRSSRPSRTRSTVDEALERWIEQLRRLRMPLRRIAELVGRSVSTVGRLLARLGLSSLKALEPVCPIVRYEHAAAGEMRGANGDHDFDTLIRTVGLAQPPWWSRSSNRGRS